MDRARAERTGLVLLALGALLTCLVYRDVSGFALMETDDFDWLAFARDGLSEPSQLFAPLRFMLRPVATWTWAIDFRVWGEEPAGYHLSNVFIQLLCGLLLYLVLRRWRFHAVLASTLVLLWWLSPYAMVTMILCATRFQTLLLASWLAMALAWPREGERWTPLGAARVSLFALLAYLSKESSVVTPLLVLALERFERRVPWRAALKTTLWAGFASGAYLMIYASVASSERQFFAPTWQLLKKIPVIVATMMEMSELQLSDYNLSAIHGLALLMLAALGYLIVRLRCRHAVIGLVLWWSPLLPTLFNPFLPQRWLIIPYVGFLIVVADVARAILAGVEGTGRRRALLAAGAAVSVLLAIAHVARARLDLVDYARLSDSFAKVVSEARQIFPELPHDRPILMLRQERDEPLIELARTSVGQRKMHYQVGHGPYGLAPTELLLDYAGIGHGQRVRRLDPASLGEGPVALLLHVRGSFVLLNPARAELEAELGPLEQLGDSPRIVVLEASD